MDQAFIMPFVKSVKNVFETMLQMPVKVGTPSIKNDDTKPLDISGIISFSGQVEGSTVLSLPMDTAVKAVGQFLGVEMDPKEEEEDFVDAIGELINMISGNAKAQFPTEKVSISCPSVVIGEGHAVFGQKDVVTITIPCKCEAGEFRLDVSFKKNSVATSDQAQSEQAAAAE